MTEARELSDALSSFRCVRLFVDAEAADPVRFPFYRGSALRGAFGHALRASSCVLRRQSCESCPLRGKCLYNYAFETPVVHSERLRKYPYAPHPFVIDPQTGGSREYRPGERFFFGMTLVGRAVDYLPYFVFAATRMGEFGVGRGRGTFRVNRISVADAEGRPGETIYRDELLSAPEGALGWREASELAGGLSGERVLLRLATPLRVRYQGEPCRDPQFHVIVRNLLRRLSSLMYFHCDRTMELGYVDWIRKAEEVVLAENRTRWMDWERYSNRQKKRMKMGGLVGEAVYEGDLEPFLPLLVVGSWVHVGKGTSFGLGSYRVGADRYDPN